MKSLKRILIFNKSIEIKNLVINDNNLFNFFGKNFARKNTNYDAYTKLNSLNQKNESESKTTSISGAKNESGKEVEHGKKNKKQKQNQVKTQLDKEENIKKTLTLRKYFPNSVPDKILDPNQMEVENLLVKRKEERIKHRDSLNKFQIKIMKKIATVRENVMRQLDDKTM